MRQSPSELFRQASAHEQAGRIASAEKSYKKAVQADPSNPDLYRALSGFYQKRGELLKAENALKRGIGGVADTAGLRVDLGAFYQQTGRPEDAAVQLQSVLADQPDHPAALVNLAGLCFTTGRYGDGLTHADNACRVAPDHPAPHSNRGSLLAALGRHEEADAAFDRARTLDPDFADAAANRANHLKNSGRIDQAVTAYRDGMARFPKDPRFAFGFSLSCLGTGDLKNGWAFYEAGFATGDRQPDRRADWPEWVGGDLAAKTLLVWPEQGLGDEILFASCLPDLIRALPNTSLVLECDRRLVSIYRRSFPTIDVKPEDGIDVGKIDLQVPIGRLSGIFRQRTGDFPGQPTYLSADPVRAGEARNWLAKLPNGRKVGINWRSGLITQKRAHGLTELADWAALLITPGIVPVNLQYGDCEDELVAIEQRLGIRIFREPDLDLKDDLEGVFALIASLDAIVNVGTSVMAMAGALGRPNHVLLREQEWITLGTGRLPWFSTATVHERNLGDDWRAAIDSALAALIV